MDNWIAILASLAGGFLLLWRGADWLVDGSTQIARRFAVPTLVVGLTIVAFGTSAPEIVVSAMAAAEGKPDLSLGNVLGSNVANIGLVLGACALVLPAVMQKRMQAREILWLLASLAALWVVSLDRAISRTDAGILVGLVVLYNVHVLVTSKPQRTDVAAPVTAEPGNKRPWLWTFLGFAAILIGARLVVSGAEAGAFLIGIPKSVVGLTVVAVGTSLPELAAGLGGALKGETDISLGNVVGSNVFNLLAVIGIVGLIQPLDPAALPEASADLDATFAQALAEDFWVVLGFSLAAIFLPLLGGERGGRLKGVLLLVAYASYSVWLYVSRMQ